MGDPLEKYQDFDFGKYTEEQKYDILQRVFEHHAAANGKNNVAGFSFETDSGRINLIGARGFAKGKVVKDSNKVFDDTLFVVYKNASGQKKVAEFDFNTEPYSKSNGQLAGRVLINGLYQYRLGNHKMSSYHSHASLEEMEQTHRFAQRHNYRALRIVKGLAFHAQNTGSAKAPEYDFNPDKPDAPTATNEHNIHYGGEGPNNRTSNWSEGCQTVKGLDNYIRLLKILEQDYSLAGTINNELIAKPSTDGKRPVVYALVDGHQIADETKIQVKFLDRILQPMINVWYEIRHGDQTISGKTDHDGDTGALYGHDPKDKINVKLQGPVGDSKQLPPVQAKESAFHKYMCVISPKVLCDGLARPDAEQSQPEITNTQAKSHKHHNKQRKPVSKIEVPKNRNPLETPIPDDEFEDCNALTLEQITSILKNNNPVLVDTYKADELLYKAAQNYKLNPKVLLATMKQEQGWAKNGRYNKLMGVGPGGDPTSMGVEQSINKSAQTYRKQFDDGKKKLSSFKINFDPNSHEVAAVGSGGASVSEDEVVAMKEGYRYTPRTASEYAKLHYTPWTYFPPQRSRPYDTWVKTFRSF
ncbi:hypothetical protein [Chromobacterium sphagni]|uniref:Uncharacterized protein n=1 Tax=Chromobacterium sphagni TaxID=1903179 RepID=A0A1S1X368_9NEIS|nr:hypothetical protein [Chromobacterium sphagni]OHX13860.1 hypothetical protein BI347_10310 [Chromobacterium sphagni]OHX20795.1 hypothetical protein BI344_13775 [Chromobacterium sphagni]